MNNRIRGLVLPIPLLLAGQVAQALGLGELKVESALEQPLKGEIKLILNAGESLEELQVRLASAADYDRVGLDPTLVPPTIALSVKNGPDGPFVEITSKLPVNEPIVSLLVEAEWPKGRLLREYTLLLDPPSYAPVATVEPASLSTPEKFDDVLEEEAPADEAGKMHDPAPVFAEQDTPVGTEEATSADDSLTREFPVHSTRASIDEVEITAGQTLWSIASEHKSEEVSVHQMMVAILRANPQAFIGGNMNRIRKGHILRIPDNDEVRTVSHTEALAEVAAQSQQWIAYQEKARDMVPEAYQVEPVAGEAETAMHSSADYELDLVPPAADDGRSGVSGRGMEADQPADVSQAELARLQEQKAALEQQREELISRIAELEGIVNDQQAVLKIKDADLAKLQQQLASLNEQKQSLEDDDASIKNDIDAISQELLAADDTAVEEPLDMAEHTDNAAVEDVNGTNEDGYDDVWSQETETEKIAQNTEDVTTAGAEDVQTEVEEPVLVTEADTNNESTTPPPATTQSWWQKIWQWLSDNPLYAGIAALALLLLGLIPRWLRRDERLDDEGGSFLDSIDQKRDDIGETPESGENAAVSEANIEELLERIKKEPDNVDLLYDATLYYYGEDDRENFESMAEELYGRLTEPSHPKWQEVIELGRKIAPENALFGVALLTEDQEIDTDAVNAESEPNSLDAETEDVTSAETDSQAFDKTEGDKNEEFSFDLDDYMPETNNDAVADDIADVESTSGNSESEQTLASDLGLDLEADLLSEKTDEPLESESGTSEPLLSEPASDEDGLETKADDSLKDTVLGDELELSLDVLEEELKAIDLDGESDLPEEAVPEVDLTGEVDLDDDQDLTDFDFGEDITAENGQTDSETDGESMKESNDNNPEEALDIGLNLDDIVPEGDAVATKLDLARAYFEMGDTEGARIMIDEVLEEGNAEQQAQARALKDEMDDA